MSQQAHPKEAYKYQLINQPTSYQDDPIRWTDPTQKNIAVSLPHQVKMQYLQIYNIVDTSNFWSIHYCGKMYVRNVWYSRYCL